MNDFPTLKFELTIDAKPKTAAQIFADRFPAVLSKQQIQIVTDYLRAQPQADLPTEHYFAGGMYCRSCTVPKHALIVGKVHTSEHLVMVLKGKITVWTELGRQDIEAPFIGVCPSGAQRVGFAHEDTVFVNVHRTDKTTVAEAEADISEECPSSMYGVGNTRLCDRLIEERV